MEARSGKHAVTVYREAILIDIDASQYYGPIEKTEFAGKDKQPSNIYVDKQRTSLFVTTMLYSRNKIQTSRDAHLADKRLYSHLNQTFDAKLSHGEIDQTVNNCAKKGLHHGSNQEHNQS